VETHITRRVVRLVARRQKATVHAGDGFPTNVTDLGVEGEEALLVVQIVFVYVNGFAG